MNDQPNDPFDELMRRALHDEADRIEPADGLHEIQARVRNQRVPANRRPWVLTAGAAVLGTAAAVGAFAVLDRDAAPAGDTEVAGPGETTTLTDPARPSTPAPSTTPSPVPSEAPTATGGPRPTASGTSKAQPGKPEASATRAVPVYWLGQTVGIDTGPGVRLYRTFSRIKGRPAYEALQLMTRGKANDPDYRSPWLGAVVGSVTRGADGLITVDFKEPPRQQLEPDVAHIALQQLVYTVQGAMDVTAPVQLTLQGRPMAQVFGVEQRQPLNRAQSLDVQAFVWIETPQHGDVLADPVKVTGLAAAHEAQLNWRLVAGKTRQPVAEGPTQTTEAYKFTPFAFTLPKLAPGSYTLEVFEISVADGRRTSTDTKTFVVK